MNFQLPPLLNHLILAGIWPTDANAERKQHLHRLASADRVRRFAAEEDQIYLQCAPFRTIADEIAAAPTIVVDEFWKRNGALNEIVAEKSLILGDFGLGSDAPIILNYAIDPIDPPVYRLRWRDNQPTTWVQGAQNFAEFVSLLGLGELPVAESPK